MMHHESAKMVVPAIIRDEPARGSRALLFADVIDLAVYDRIEGVRDEWLAAESNAQISVYQRYDWVRTYLESLKATRPLKPFIIVGRFEGETVFILPCHIAGKHVRRLKFIGGKHVNFNLGIVPKRNGPALGSQDFERILERIGHFMPGIGYVALCCQPGSWLGKTNHLITRMHQRSANPAFLLDLSDGFEATLERGNAKRKRKKFRQQVRMAEEMGGYALHSPQSTKEVAAAIETFVAQKSRRLQELGIKDVFAEEGTREFLFDMAVKSLNMKEPLLKLYTLRIGNDTAAVFGGGVHSNRMSGFFSSIDSDKYGPLSPGEMLLYLLVEDLCGKGYSQLDLGAGDERYKRSWSSEVVEMYDLFVPFNLSGAPIVAARRIYSRVRCLVRENERLWESYKRLRKLKSRLF